MCVRSRGFIAARNGSVMLMLDNNNKHFIKRVCSLCVDMVCKCAVVGIMLGRVDTQCGDHCSMQEDDVALSNKGTSFSYTSG